MSRIGRKVIELPAGVDAKVSDGIVTVKGPKDTLTMTHHPDMTVIIEGRTIKVERPSDANAHKALHGLTRALISNMVTGVSEGFKKSLDIQGVGFKAAMQGKTLVLNLGYSHPIELETPSGLAIEVPNPNKIIVSGADKQLVGETAAKIRSFRVCDAYKGKGVKYDYETVRIKEGKTGSK